MQLDFEIRYAGRKSAQRASSAIKGRQSITTACNDENTTESTLRVCDTAAASTDARMLVSFVDNNDLKRYFAKHEGAKSFMEYLINLWRQKRDWQKEELDIALINYECQSNKLMLDDPSTS